MEHIKVETAQKCKSNILEKYLTDFIILPRKSLILRELILLKACILVVAQLFFPNPFV
jgi:hypothetical protein